MPTTERPGLGRRFAPDPRDRAFRMAALAPQSTREFRYWNDAGWTGNQGATSRCVAFAFLHWLEGGPVTQNRGPAPIIDPDVLYHEAQTLDEWPGEDYDGTSVRAGAKALQARGFITAYHWADTVADVVNAVLEVGPVVMGTIWTEAMFTPDPAGFIKADGPVAGGHAWVINGVNRKRRVFKAKQSWGTDWGKNGHFAITFDEMEKLRAQEWEACLATEVRV